MNGLEHFYYGQLVHHGKTKGEARILARSRGISEDLANVVIRQAALSARADLPRSAWGIVRSKEVPFIFVQAQKVADGQTLRHFILLPSDIPRALSGKLNAYLSLVEERLTIYEMLGDTLSALQFQRPPARSLAQQADDLLSLMTYVGNNTRTIEPLLSAIVEGRILHIKNAPPEPEARVGLLQGLLTLLPPSTRFSLTFALYHEGEEVNVQLRFSDAPAPEGAVVYDWQTHAVQGMDSPNEYSRFIVSQLRLDAENAVQQAESLTQTAGWRFRVGDNLGEALAYASYRSKLDKSVLSSLPVEVKEVAEVLSSDPTLDDGLRIAYARHLLNFSLALDDASYTDGVAVTMAKFPDFARDIQLQLEDSASQGKAGIVFQTLRQWADNPLSPQGPEWVDLLHRSALSHLNALVKARNVDGIKRFLDDTQLLEGGLLLEKIAPRIIEALVSVASEDDAFPSRILLMGMIYLEKPAVQKLLALKNLTTLLPRDMKRFLAALAQPNTQVPAGVLKAAADTVGERGHDQALLRLADMAHGAQRHTLLDASTLAELVRVARSPIGEKYTVILLNLARAVHARLEHLTPDEARYVLQLFLACRRVDLVARSMVEQARDYYGADRQEAYVASIHRVFAEIQQTPSEARKTLETLSDNGIKDAPLMIAVCGTLEASQYAPELKDYAQEISDEITSAERYVSILPATALMSLLQYFMRNPDEKRLYYCAILTAKLVAQLEDKTSLSTLSQAYKLLNPDKSNVAFELLRQYARSASPKTAERVVSYYGKELGGQAESRLRIAYEFSLFMGREALASYAPKLHTSAEMLQALLETYYAKDKPSIPFLDALIENMRVRIDSAKHLHFANGLQRMARALVHIGKPEGKTGTLSDPKAPKHALDVMRLAGVHFSQGKVNALKLRAEKPLSPLGNSTPQQWVNEVNDCAELLRSAANAFPMGKSLSISAAQLTEELDALLKSQASTEVSTLSAQLGQDWQRLAQSVLLLVKDSDTSVLQDESRMGKKLDSQSQQPRNSLEFLRFVYGFWLS